MKILFIRHFKPKVEKDKPVSEWDLDEEGKKQMEVLLSSRNFSNIKKIFTSPEKKAKITAKKINEKYNIPIRICKEIEEVDRSKAGFIEGDYIQIVRSYLTKSKSFKYAWEKINDVEKRIKKFLKIIEKEKDDLLVISHGMWLSILLSKYFKEDIIDFWQSLKFGELLEVDYNELKKDWESKIFKCKMED